MAKIKVLKNGYYRINKKGFNNQSQTVEAIQNNFRKIAKISDIKRVVLVNKSSKRFYYFLVEGEF